MDLLNIKIKPHLLLVFVLFVFHQNCYAQSKVLDKLEYGANESVGRFSDVNGIKMYYEIYGEGEPLVLIHGNDQSIADLKHQIKYLSGKFKIIVADSRGHGKSELNTKNLNFGEMANDWFALISHLGLTNVNVFGWSDGGVLGLKLAIEHPEIIKKLAIMGSNTLPPEFSAYPWASKSVRTYQKHIDGMIAANDNSRDWLRAKQVVDLLFTDPNISNHQLESITIPVLVMAGDKDVIIAQHTLSIFQNIKNSHLVIFPGQTHFVPITDPKLFNSELDKFYTLPFRRPDTKDYF